MTADVVSMKPLPNTFFADKLANVVTGMGTDRDKSSFRTYSFTVPVKSQLDAAYRADWIARKIIDVPVNDGTRMWRDWQAENEVIEKIEEAEKLLNVRAKFNRADRMARLYGGSILVMGIDNSGSPEEPLDVNKVKKDSLKFVHAVSRYALTPGQPVTDLMSPWYGQPEYYETTTGEVSLENKVAALSQPGKSIAGVRRIHASRVVRLIGNEILDDQQSLSTDCWGDSILTVVEEAVKNAGEAGAAILNVLREMRIDVLGIPNLMNNLATTEYTNRLTERLSYVNLSKSVWGTLVHDKEEEWEQVSASLAGSPDLLKLYLIIACGAADIPATRFLGQSAIGLGATGEGDMRNYYDRIKSDQETRVTPAMDTLDQVLIRSATGTKDPNSYYEWTSLLQMTEVEKADLAKKKADVYKIDVDTGLISDEALAKARQNQLIEDGFYPGLEEALDEVGNDGLDEPEPGALELMEAEAAQAAQAAKLAKPANTNTPLKRTADGQPVLDARNWFVIEDEFNPNQPRDPKGTPTGGQWTAQIKGSTAERVAMRKMLKSEHDPEKRKTLKEQIIKSFEVQLQKAKKKGDLAKVAELEGKINKFSKEYGVPNPVAPKTIAEANLGYTKEEITGAQQVMKEAVPENGSKFSPEEVKAFNDLVSISGVQNAKSYMSEAKAALSSAPQGMSHVELAHIIAYSRDAYVDTNRGLRYGVMSEERWRHVNALNKALSDFSDHTGTVYRRASVPADIAAMYKPGMIVTEHGFTSTSKSVRTGPVSFVITSKTGKDISKVSHYPHEQEVLFRSGTRFKIINSNGTYGNIKVFMEEIQ